MHNPSSIERVVMRRAGRIAFLRPLFSRTAFSAVVGIAALWGLGREVWVARVLENAPHSLSDVPQFYLAAFFHTELAVQILVVVMMIAFFSLSERFARRMSELVVPQHA